MHTRRCLLVALLLTSTLTATAQVRAIDEPNFITKIMQRIKHIVQPLADELVPPHPENPQP